MIISLLISATFWVDTSTDASDASVGDGICQTSAGDCSLRAAIEEANYQAGMDTIRFKVSPVYLDNTVYIYDSIYLSGSFSIDSIFCTSFTGDCLYSESYLGLRNIYIRSLGTGISSRSHLSATKLYIEAGTYAIYSSNGKTDIRNSTLSSNDWGIVSFDDSLFKIRSSTIITQGTSIQYSTTGTLAPDSIVNNNIESSKICLDILLNGKNSLIKNNTLRCTNKAIQIVDESSNPAIPESLIVDTNLIYIYDKVGAIHVEGCTACEITNNRLLGTDSSGYFIYLKSVNNSYIWNNSNLDGTTYTDAGTDYFIKLENSDSNIIRKNRWAFSYQKSATGGIELYNGSDFNKVDSNYVANIEWGGIAIFDSSSFNEFYLDSIVNTAGIQIRRHWEGRYAFPFDLGFDYTGPVGKGNIFKHIYSVGNYYSMMVIGMDSTVVDSSTLKTSNIWGIVINNAGSDLYVYNSILEGSSTATDTGGYGVSLEYFYGAHAIPSQATDDSLFKIYMENTQFWNLAYAFRVMDIDTSYIKLDTLFDNNNNSIQGYTTGFYGEYYLPVIVQTLDLSCTPTIRAIDSVRLEDRWGNAILLNKLNSTDALWSFHWEPYNDVIYDSLHTWYQARALYYDNLGNLGTPNPHTVRLFGKRDTTATVDIERGLANYSDPCPSSGLNITQTVYPKTVDNRWLVIKVQYDPDLLPIDYPSPPYYT